MSKRKVIVELLKQIKPLIIEKDRPTSFFISGNEGEEYRKLNISDISVNKDYIVVTVGKYLFKRKYHVKKDHI